MARPADHAQREQAIAERERNVLIDAGAGTGKTTLLADRVVELIAPRKPGVTPLPIERLAAITFTRKAAGELRLRIREKLLAAAAEAAQDPAQAKLLREALAGLDTAYLSTIHSFCDRLLRLRPIEARLSPSYEIAEEPDDLVSEAFALLYEAAQDGKLADLLAGTPAAGLAGEAQATVLDAIAVGLRRDTIEAEFYSRFGLDALVSAFVLQRDVPFRLPDAEAFDQQEFKDLAKELGALADGVDGPERGARWVARLARQLKTLSKQADPVALWTQLAPHTHGPLRKLSDVKMKEDFGGRSPAWAFLKAFRDGDDKAQPPEAPLHDQLLAPLQRWMAKRLVRLRPVVLALYNRVKARRRQLDQIDLLLLLRNLLAENHAARAYYQGLFDHLFVDEFQDTDPLQAEVVLFLCERSPVATRWEDVALQAGKLTLVGDPKQSIYRFRRADIAVYEQVREHVKREACLSVTLSANFRSAASLIHWVNERFAEILGPATKGAPLFDAQRGTVAYQPLQPGPNADPGSAPRVRSLPLLLNLEKGNVDNYRAAEGQAVARYLRKLVEDKGTVITDPLDGRSRPLRYGDIAVLTLSTFSLHFLFDGFERHGVPYAARGGKLLLQEPLHRQFLLALRGLADRDDGPAQVALLGPPFFAVEVLDLLHGRAQTAAAKGNPLAGTIDPERAARAEEVLAFLADLRRRRLVRPVSATARDLVEKTAFGRSLATGPNGEQRLARVHELIRAIDALATAEGFDFDAATERAREWVDDPVQLDPPHPVGAEAVQALTVHQAKGLEFPLVVLWDGAAAWKGQAGGGAFRTSRDGTQWALKLEGLEWAEPRGTDLAKQEETFRDAERRRVVYVAATRARDYFVSAAPGCAKTGKHISADLLVDESGERIEVLATLADDGKEPAWVKGIKPVEPVPVVPLKGKVLQAALQREESAGRAWEEAAAKSGEPVLVPVSVTALAHAGDEAEYLRSRAAEAEAGEGVGPSEERPQRKRHQSRFGNRFGDAVHRAIGFCLQDPLLPVREAVARAARVAELEEHLDEAAGDVERTLSTLRSERLLGEGWRLEYPVWSSMSGQTLVQGFIDLLGVAEDGLAVIDFKTDAPPSESVEEERPAYVEQVHGYRDLLEEAGVRGGAPTRCALLFTADGVVRWC